MEEKIEVIRTDTMSKVNLQDKEIIELASKARNSNKFKSLYYDGATSDYSSASEADLALCSIIAYYTNSEEQIDRIFRSSALDRTKWDREDYRSRTIRKAIEGLANINSLDQKKPINSKLSTIADYLNDPEGFDKHMASQRGRKDIKTGFEQLDNTLGGGLYPGLYVLGAMSALGKTALCGQIADSIAINDNHTLFFSLEMSQYELICRSITRHLFLSDPRKYQTVNTNSIMNARFNDNDFSIIKSKYSQQIGQNYTIHHGNFNISTDTIRKIIQETVETCKKNLVVFVDYLQVINPAKPNMSDKQAVDQNITELKQMSRDFDIPIVVISSFNRSNYSTSVSFAAFKESGCIEYTADVVLGLQLEGAGEKDTDIGELLKKNPRRVELVILKNRRGKSNEKVSMSYYPAQNYFEEF